MSQHITYTSRREEPVYIGFDEQDPKKQKKSNGFGAAATFFGILGLLSSGLMFPIIVRELYTRGYVNHPPFVIGIAIPIAGAALSILAVVFASIGIFKKPRKYAILGGLLGLVPIAGIMGWNHHLANQIRKNDYAHRVKMERRFTEKQITIAKGLIEKFREKHDGELPDGLAGNRITIQLQDSWDTELRYEPTDTGYVVRSAGPDKKFETGDDCFRSNTIGSYTTSVK